MSNKFNKKEYEKKYYKENRKLFGTTMTIQEYENITNFLKENNISKIEFIRESFNYLKIKLKKER